MSLPLTTVRHTYNRPGLHGHDASIVSWVDRPDWKRRYERLEIGDNISEEGLASLRTWAGCYGIDAGQVQPRRWLERDLLHRQVVLVTTTDGLLRISQRIQLEAAPMPFPGGFCVQWVRDA